MKEDEYFYRLLKKLSFEEIVNLIKSLNSNVKLIENKLDYDIYQKQKLRIIDPTIQINGLIFRLSEKSHMAKKLTEEATIKANEWMFIKIIT
ncbi:hypothetical protein ABFP60_18340 [Clostridioides difficile]